MSSGWPFNQIHHIIWRSKRFRSLESADDKLLLFWYMTNEHQNALGFFRCPDHWPAADLQWEVKRVAESRKRLEECCLIYFDEDSEELYVDQWLRFAVKPSRQVFGGYQRQVDNIESDYLREQVVTPALMEAEGRWTGEQPKASKSADQHRSSEATITPQLEAALARNRGRG